MAGRIARQAAAAAARTLLLLPGLAAAAAGVPLPVVQRMVGQANWTMFFPEGNGGIVYLDKTPQANTLFVANGNEVLALNASNGHTKWSWACQYDSPVVLSQLSSCGMVLYAFCNTSIMMIDTQGANGPFPTTIEAGGLVTAPGILNEPYLYYVVQSIPAGSATTVYYDVRALNLDTGTLEWYVQAPEGVTLYGPPVFASDMTQIVVAGDTSYWLTACCGANALAGEKVGLENGATSVFNLMTGGAPGACGPTVCFSAEDSMCCDTYSALGGGTVSTQCFPGYATVGSIGRGVSSPTNYAFVGTQSGDIVMSYMMDGTTASSPWRAWLGQPFSAPGVMSPDNSQLYIGSLSGTVVALDAISGACLWTLPVSGSVAYAGVLNSDGTLLFEATTMGEVVAINLAGTMPAPPDDTMDLVIVAGAAAGVVVLGVIGAAVWLVRTSRLKAASRRGSMVGAASWSRRASESSVSVSSVSGYERGKATTYGSQPLMRQQQQ
jgi:outer membrane protein assembly factor BamB